TLFYACSEEQKDLSLAEALRRLLSLALAKAREVGIIAEDAVLALIDAVMSFAIDMLQTGKRLQLVNSEFA
ncbi:MAG: IS4 family transposase, partial [Bacteroidia bacterium]|nr:IS4 family transposase [Bacteroidia bacterium]